MIGTSPWSSSTTGINGPVIFLTCLTIGLRNWLMNLPASRFSASKPMSRSAKSRPWVVSTVKPQKRWNLPRTLGKPALWPTLSPVRNRTSMFA